MIKIFRNIRRNLLAEGEITKYLKYAIGEIFLVVIGILIALYLNDLNEKRIDENKIISILKEVQKDLKEDIIKSEEFFAYNKTRDSIMFFILSNELTRENYLNIGNEYLLAARDPFHLKIHTNGYQHFSDNLEKVPDKYQEIIALLNEIYISNKYDIDRSQGRIDKISGGLIENIITTKPWYYSMLRGQVSDDAIHYFLNDSILKNTVLLSLHVSDNFENQVNYFSQNAIKAYHKIAKLRGSPIDLPDFIPHNLIDATPQQFQELLGNYTLVKIKFSSGKIWERSSPFIMDVDGPTLEFTDVIGNETESLYFKNSTTLHGRNIEVTILKDEKDRVIGLKMIRPINHVTEFIKTE